MGKDTSIGWTHHTFNAWWGCTEVSPECDHCYARIFAERTGHKVWGADAPRRMLSEKYWNQPIEWDYQAQKAGERRRVFCSSMADVFEFRPDLDPVRERLFDLIGSTPFLDWLLLTKRPEQMPRMAPRAWQEHGWPRNVWAGTTAGTRETLELRAPRLKQVPALVRFISGEPLLEDVFAQPYDLTGIHWLILGGESTPKARPCHLEWIEHGIEGARANGLKIFVKQLGHRPRRIPFGATAQLQLHRFGGRTDFSEAMLLKDKLKGEDWDEWPAHLRIREYPEVARCG